MIIGREANRVSVPISPREGLDVARVVQLCSKDGAVADPLSNLARDRIEERRHGPSGIGHTKGRVTASEYPVARSKHVLAKLNVLAWDIRLVRTATVVETNDPAVGRRSLRPVDPPAFERELFAGMVTRRQVGDEWHDLPSHRVHSDDARTVV